MSILKNVNTCTLLTKGDDFFSTTFPLYLSAASLETRNPIRIRQSYRWPVIDIFSFRTNTGNSSARFAAKLPESRSTIIRASFQIKPHLRCNSAHCQLFPRESWSILKEFPTWEISDLQRGEKMLLGWISKFEISELQFFKTAHFLRLNQLFAERTEKLENPLESANLIGDQS